MDGRSPVDLARMNARGKMLESALARYEKEYAEHAAKFAEAITENSYTPDDMSDTMFPDTVELARVCVLKEFSMRVLEQRRGLAPGSSMDEAVDCAVRLLEEQILEWHTRYDGQIDLIGMHSQMVRWAVLSRIIQRWREREELPPTGDLATTCLLTARRR